MTDINKVKAALPALLADMERKLTEIAGGPVGLTLFVFGEASTSADGQQHQAPFCSLSNLPRPENVKRLTAAIERWAAPQKLQS